MTINRIPCHIYTRGAWEIFKNIPVTRLADVISIACGFCLLCVCTRMPGYINPRRFRSVLLCVCFMYCTGDVSGMPVTPLVRWLLPRRLIRDNFRLEDLLLLLLLLLLLWPRMIEGWKDPTQKTVHDSFHWRLHSGSLSSTPRPIHLSPPPPSFYWSPNRRERGCMSVYVCEERGVKGKNITVTDDYGDGDVYRKKKERC